MISRIRTGKCKRAYGKTLTALEAGLRALAEQEADRGAKKKIAAEVSCPVCGYLCLGKGGMGCIDKPAMV